MTQTGVFRVFGIPVVLSPSWFVIAGLITLSLRATFERANPTSSSAALWGAAVLASLLFFVGVVIHEASHSAMARRLGLGVSSIRLFVFGGVSQLEEEPRTAREELLVTVVGPLSSVVIGLVFLGAAAVVPGPRLAVSILDWLGVCEPGIGLVQPAPRFSHGRRPGAAGGGVAVDGEPAEGNQGCSDLRQGGGGTAGGRRVPGCGRPTA